MSTTTCSPAWATGWRPVCAPGLGQSDTDSVFRRSFSALILAECIARDTERPLVPGGKVLEWGDRIATWILEERDLRGFVPGKGWAHAVAHGADALATLARSPHVGQAELNVLLDVIAERLALPVDAAVHPWRARPARVRRRWRCCAATGCRSRPWSRGWPGSAGPPAAARPPVTRTSSAATPRPSCAPSTSSSRWAPSRRAVRADLLLLLVDELRLSNPRTLGTDRSTDLRQ